MVEIAIMMGQKQPECQFLCDKGENQKLCNVYCFLKIYWSFAFLKRKKDIRSHDPHRIPSFPMFPAGRKYLWRKARPEYRDELSKPRRPSGNTPRGMPMPMPLLVWVPLHAGVCKIIFIGPESDHWECLSLTDSLTHWLTHWLLFRKLDWCDPSVWR